MGIAGGGKGMPVSTDVSGYDSVQCVEVPLMGKQTFYARYGNIIDPALAVFGVVLVCVGAFLPKKSRR